jgi:hypothetical protein
MPLAASRVANLSRTGARVPGHNAIIVLAIAIVDLGAFVLLGASALVVGAFVIGLGFWLRARANHHAAGDESGL